MKDLNEWADLKKEGNIDGSEARRKLSEIIRNFTKKDTEGNFEG